MLIYVMHPLDRLAKHLPEYELLNRLRRKPNNPHWQSPSISGNFIAKHYQSTYTIPYNGILEREIIIEQWLFKKFTTLPFKCI